MHPQDRFLDQVIDLITRSTSCDIGTQEAKAVGEVGMSLGQNIDHQLYRGRDIPDSLCMRDRCVASGELKARPPRFCRYALRLLSLDLAQGRSSWPIP